jgi:hypothetical protein
MKRVIIVFGLMAMAFLVNAADNLPQVFSLDAKALQANRVKVQNKDPYIMPAYKSLLKEADKFLSFGPVSVMEKKNNPPSGDRHDYMSLAPYYWPDPAKADGLPYIRKDGQTNPEVKDYKDKEYLPKLCEAVNTLGLAYYFSGNEAYAAHAAKLLEVWFLDSATKMNPNLNYGQAMKGHNEGRGAGMIDTRHFVILIDGIGLINGSKKWSTADQKGMQDWFAQFLVWMQTSRNGVDELNAKNNHGVWYDAQRMSMALFTGDKALAEKIVLNAEKRLDSQMDSTGLLPLELERTIALHYSTFAMDAFFIIAKMGEQVNMNLWDYKSPSGKSLQKGFDALKPYYAGEKQWAGMQIKPFEFEEAYPLLTASYKKYNCRDCIEAVRHIAQDQLPKLRLKLLTDVEL